MELKVPKCALKGLELNDVMFNDDENCALTSTEDGSHFTWKIDYTDCGTTKNVSFKIPAKKLDTLYGDFRLVFDQNGHEKFSLMLQVG